MAISTTVTSYRREYQVYSDCRVMLFDALQDSEPLFERFEHAYVLSYIEIDHKLWSELT